MTTYRVIYETYVEAEDLWEAINKCDKIKGLELIGIGEERFQIGEIFPNNGE